MGDGELEMLESLLHTVDQLPDIPSRELLLAQLVDSANSCLDEAVATTKQAQAIRNQILNKQETYPAFQDKIRRGYWEISRKAAEELDDHYLRFKEWSEDNPRAATLLNWRGTELWWEPIEGGKHWEVFKQLTPDSRLHITMQRVPFDPQFERQYGWDDHVSIGDVSKWQTTDDVLLVDLLVGCPSMIRRVRSSSYMTVGELQRAVDLPKQRGMGKDILRTLARVLLKRGFTPTW
ncbi:MAG: hypothetical protein NUV80_01770 [Candidatus Berkelbacteria bacterium]|nr:hypothetical protein [Candidatus Berkelbacteria bacterium]MCR4307266.1 hypothetical protein [Candidatus Berkelbacteria bacterium]